jgi:hypothetical protein
MNESSLYHKNKDLKITKQNKTKPKQEDEE